MYRITAVDPYRTRDETEGESRDRRVQQSTKRFRTSSKSKAPNLAVLGASVVRRLLLRWVLLNYSSEDRYFRQLSRKESETRCSPLKCKMRFYRLAKSNLSILLVFKMLYFRCVKQNSILVSNNFTTKHKETWWFLN